MTDSVVTLTPRDERGSAIAIGAAKALGFDPESIVVDDVFSLSFGVPWREAYDIVDQVLTDVDREYGYHLTLHVPPEADLTED